MHASTSVVSASGHRHCHLAIAFTYRVHELDLRNIELYTHSFKIYGMWPQASKHTYAHAQCSPASVGLAQAHSNHHLPYE